MALPDKLSKIQNEEKTLLDVTRNHVLYILPLYHSYNSLHHPLVVFNEVF